MKKKNYKNIQLNERKETNYHVDLVKETTIVTSRKCGARARKHGIDVRAEITGHAVPPGVGISSIQSAGK